MSNAHHVVVGAGGIGRSTARQLARQGHSVTMLSRSGTDPEIAGVKAESANATDEQALIAAASGAASIVNAVNPKSYSHWERDWPPVATALLRAAEQTGAGLVTVSNLYPYGRVEAPMTESTEIRPNGRKGRVRAQMWAEALAAHEAGRIRATELRASDYFGPGAGRQVSFLNDFVIRPAAAGRTVRLIMGVPDALHSWTYLDDIGALAARLATDDRSWGRAWHVPSADPRTLRQVAEDTAAIAGVPAPAVSPLPSPVKRLAEVVPAVREFRETAHQFERSYVLDSSAARTTFGLEPTPWEEALEATVAHIDSSDSSR